MNKDGDPDKTPSLHFPVCEQGSADMTLSQLVSPHNLSIPFQSMLLRSVRSEAFDRGTVGPIVCVIHKQNLLKHVIKSNCQLLLA